MHIDYCITGSFPVPDGTTACAGILNQFLLPSGEVISVHPVIEMASTIEADDHHDLRWSEMEAFGIALQLYERVCTLEDDG
ncbi:hypothetical protein BH10PSE12_BH10PSE12_07750 [soil metagenome]